MSATGDRETGGATHPRRAVGRWKAAVILAGCILLLTAALVTVRSIGTLREHADEAPSDGRLQQAHEDLVHATLTGLAGAGLAVGVGLRGYAVVRRATP